MLSQTAEYALRAAVWLATHTDRPQTTMEIADGMAVPPLYLAKVMQVLVRAGVVRGQRGRTGGFVLVKPASETSIYEVVNGIDPVRRIKECPLGLAEHREQLCPLHARLDQSLAVIENDFKQTCLADLIERRTSNA